MKIRITKCKDKQSWHSDYVGHELDVIAMSAYNIGGCYNVYVKEYGNVIVPVDDCEIIVPSNHQKAIGMLAECEGDYEKQLYLVESLLNQLDASNEARDTFKNLLPTSHEKQKNKNTDQVGFF